MSENRPASKKPSRPINSGAGPATIYGFSYAVEHNCRSETIDHAVAMAAQVFLQDPKSRAVCKVQVPTRNNRGLIREGGRRRPLHPQRQAIARENNSTSLPDEADDRKWQRARHSIAPNIPGPSCRAFLFPRGARRILLTQSEKP